MRRLYACWFYGRVIRVWAKTKKEALLISKKKMNAAPQRIVVH